MTLSDTLELALDLKSTGQLQDSLQDRSFREFSVMVKTIVFSRELTQECFLKHKKSNQGIKCKNFVDPLFGEKLGFSNCRTKSKSVLQNHDLSCSRPLVSCRRYKPSEEPARVLRFGPGHPGTTTEPTRAIRVPGKGGKSVFCRTAAGQNPDLKNNPESYGIIMSCTVLQTAPD